MLFLSVAVSACGYSLAGRGSFLPAYIKTVGVPVFTNRTQVFEIEQILTQRVRAEFIGRGKYQVLPNTTGADALLVGEITSVSVQPAGFTGERQASRYVFTITARIEFRDLKSNTVLWENPSLVFTDEYEVTSATASTDAAAFFGQERNAVERVASDFARTVVSAIMEAF